MATTAGDERTRLLLLTNTVQIGGMEEHVRLIAKDLDSEQFVVTVWPCKAQCAAKSGRSGVGCILCLKF